jgi:hypothetical protein
VYEVKKCSSTFSPTGWVKASGESTGSSWSHSVLGVPETQFHCAGICLAVLHNRQALSQIADDRSAWMLEIPAFQFFRFAEVAVIGELQV